VSNFVTKLQRGYAKMVRYGDLITLFGVGLTACSRVIISEKNVRETAQCRNCAVKAGN